MSARAWDERRWRQRAKWPHYHIQFCPVRKHQGNTYRIMSARCRKIKRQMKRRGR